MAGFLFSIIERFRKIDIKSTKDKIRKKVKKIRDKISYSLIIDKSYSIWEKLKNSEDFNSAHTVMFYSAIDNEVQTEFMIKESIRMGKKIVLPQTVSPNILIPKIIYNYPSDLSPGIFGILEPTKDMPIIKKNEIDIIIVPGIAFSKDCMRIGYGKGYYDSFLKDYYNKKVGIAFWEQVVGYIPKDTHDVLLDKIITDKTIIYCNKN